MPGVDADLFSRWYDALEARHLRDLDFREVRRGLQALSASYVERREGLRQGAAFSGRGKRAAFALFYGASHFAVTYRVVREIGLARGLGRILDLGCGSGAAGAAWCVAARKRPALEGLDVHPWAVEEADWCRRWFGLSGTIRRGRLETGRVRGPRCGILLAYVVNELGAEERDALLGRLLAAHGKGARVLVVEPISRRVAPWLDAWAGSFRDAGGRADTWSFPAEMPERWRLLDRAAGLDHRSLKARTLALGV